MHCNGEGGCVGGSRIRIRGLHGSRKESRVENAMIIFCFHLNIVSVVGAHGEGGVGGGREGVSPRPPHHLRHRLQLRPSSQTETATCLLLTDKSSTTSKSLLFGNTLSNRLTEFNVKDYCAAIDCHLCDQQVLFCYFYSINHNRVSSDGD